MCLISFKDFQIMYVQKKYSVLWKFGDHFCNLSYFLLFQVRTRSRYTINKINLVFDEIAVLFFQKELCFKFFTIALVKNVLPQRSFKKNWETCNTFVVILNKIYSVSLVKILIFFPEVNKYQFLADTLDFQIGPILNKVSFLNQIRSGLLICSLSQCVNKFSYLISSNLPIPI